MANILGATTGSFAKLKALSEAARTRPAIPMTGSAADRRENQTAALSARRVLDRENA